MASQDGACQSWASTETATRLPLLGRQASLAPARRRKGKSRAIQPPRKATAAGAAVRALGRCLGQSRQGARNPSWPSSYMLARAARRSLESEAPRACPPVVSEQSRTSAPACCPERPRRSASPRRLLVVRSGRVAARPGHARIHARKRSRTLTATPQTCGGLGGGPTTRVRAASTRPTTSRSRRSGGLNERCSPGAVQLYAAAPTR
jgi:hypothetical protein